MPLLALTKVPRGVRRIALSQGLAQQVGALFRAQEEDLLGGNVEIVPFDGHYHPNEDDNELLEIANFVDQLGLAEASANPINVPLFELSAETIGTIAGLCWSYVEGGERRFLLQTFDKRRAITNDDFTLWHDQNTFRRLEGIGITLDNRLAAVLAGTSLVFRRFHQVRGLFDMAHYYAEATNEELEEFAEHERICLADGLDLMAMADTQIRRRVGLIAEIGILDEVAPRRLAQIARQCNIVLRTRRVDGQDRIELPASRKELKAVLKFLCDDYLQSMLRDARYVTNSKRLLTQEAGAAA